MARRVYYELDYTSVAGQQDQLIDYTLELIADDAVVLPSEVPGYLPDNEPIKLVGGTEPISVEHIRRDNPYYPILGSAAVINLLVTDDTTYIDFNSSPSLTWEVRLKYKDTSDNSQDYWCGYIVPEDGKEQVTTTPFPVSFTATDGLGLLGQHLYPIGSDVAIDSTDPINCVDLITELLRQTGNELDLYIWTGIENATGDFLINTSLLQNAFSDEDEMKRSNAKEILEGILASINCKIFQAEGKWFIVNNSSLPDVPTFKVFGFDGTAKADDTKDLRQYLGGTNETIKQINTPFDFIPRLAAGSVQADVRTTTPINYVDNSNFNDVTPFGWNSLDEANFRFSTTTLNGRSLYTTNNGAATDLWFNNSTGLSVDYNAPFKLTADYYQDIQGSVIYGTKITAYLWVELPTPITGAKLVSNGLGFFSLLFGQSPITRETFQTTVIQWKTRDERWEPIEGNAPSYAESYQISFDVDSVRGWAELEQEVTKLGTRVNGFEGNELIPEGGVIRVAFSLPQLLNEDDEVISKGTRTDFQLSVDNVAVRNVFTNDDLNPVFERVQPNELQTINYQPLLYSHPESSVGTYQRLATTDYWRDGVDKTEANALSINEIVTQQILNDNRDQFKYYEGEIVALNNKPLSQIDKILIDFPDQGYVETSFAQLNGGTFNPKANSYKLAMYVPDQGTDIDSVFHTEDVNLIAAPFPGKVNALYVLQFEVTGTVDTDGNPVADGLTPVKTFAAIEGTPGDTVQTTVRLTPKAGYRGSMATIAADTTAEPRPKYIRYRGDNFTYVQGDMELVLEIIIPEDPEFETLYIDGVVEEFSGEATPDPVPCSVVIDWSTNLINDGSLVPSSATAPSYRTIFNTSGIPGSDIHFTYFVESRSTGNAANGGIGWNLDAPNFSISETATSLTNLDARQVGVRTIAIDFEYSVPTTPETVAVELIGEATNPSTVDNPVWDYTVTFETSGDNFTLFETTNTFRGTENSVIPYNLLVNPNEGYDLRAGAYTYGTGDPVVTDTLPNGISVRSNTPTGFVQNGEEVVLPINVTIGDGHASGEITITGTPQTEPYSLTFLVNDVGSEGWTISNSQKLQPYGTTDFDGDIPTFTFYVTPNENMVFTDGNQAHIDNQVVANVDEVAIDLPESQFTISRDYVSAGEEPGDPNVGKIKCVVAGKFPILTNLPNFPHHATVSINISGSAGTGPATSPTNDFTLTTTDGNITIVLTGIDGGWSLTPNTPIGTPVGGGSAFGVRYTGDAFDTFTTFTPNVGNVENNVIYTTLAAGRSANPISIPVFPLGSATALFNITLNKNATGQSGLPTIGYALTAQSVPNGNFIGYATYTDGQGSEKLIGNDTGTPLEFCAVEDSAVAVAGTVNEVSTISCGIGTVSGGQTYSDEAGNSAAIGGATVVYTSTSPTSSSADGIYFIEQ